MDGREHRYRLGAPLVLLGALAALGVGILLWCPVSILWGFLAVVLIVLGIVMARHHAWIKWLSFVCSLVSLLLAGLLVETGWPLAILSMLYLFVWL